VTDRARETVWRRAVSAAYVESEGRVVVLDLDRPELPPYVFEGSAADVWTRVDGVRSEADIATGLAEAYGAPVEVVASDVRQFVARLGELGLVVGDDGL
jgi:Coenzyme PQQ synthesis protein D (PqqD)